MMAMPRLMEQLAVEVVHVVGHHRRRADVECGRCYVPVLRVVVHVVDEVLVPLDRRGRERPPHCADRPLEMRRIDGGVVHEHVSGHLVEDRLRPARIERFESAEREQQIAQDDRIEDAGIQDVDRSHRQ